MQRLTCAHVGVSTVCSIRFNLHTASEKLHPPKLWVDLSDLAHIRISFDKHRLVCSASVDFCYRCHAFIDHFCSQH